MTGIDRYFRSFAHSALRSLSLAAALTRSRSLRALALGYLGPSLEREQLAPRTLSAREFVCVFVLLLLVVTVVRVRVRERAWEGRFIRCFGGLARTADAAVSCIWQPWRKQLSSRRPCRRLVRVERWGE